MAKAGHIFAGTVGIGSRHQELLFLVAGHQPLGREHLDSHHPGVIGSAVGHALPDPAREQVEGRGISVNPKPAAVRDRRRGLEQEQAPVGGSRKQTASPSLDDQIFEIFLGLEAQQRQPEAVLTRGLAVAASAVTPRLGEDGNNLVGEIHASGLADLSDGKAGAGGKPLRKPGRDLNRSIG